MTFSVKMPALGESVTEGTVTRWFKSEGDQVALDEPLLEVSTDKVDTEIPSPAAGTLQKIMVAVDQTAAVGAELAIIADGATASAAPKESPKQTVQEVKPVPTPTVNPTPAVNTASETIVLMPALGESVSEGTVTRWLKSVGDQISADEPLLEVSTDKVDTEIPAPASGTLLSIDVPVDSTVPVGARLATIGATSGQRAPAPTPPIATAPIIQAAPKVAPAPAPAPTQLVSSAKPVLIDAYVTPIVRKLANENGVNLASIKGTGVGGRIPERGCPRRSCSPSERYSTGFITPTSKCQPSFSSSSGFCVTVTRHEGDDVKTAQSYCSSYVGIATS